MKQSLITIPKMTARQRFNFKALGMQNNGKELAKHYLLTLAGFRTDKTLKPRQAVDSLIAKHDQFKKTMQLSLELDSRITNRGQGTILEWARRKKRDLFRNFVDHKPASKETDWLGIEIECLIPVEAFNGGAR